MKRFVDARKKREVLLFLCIGIILSIAVDVIIFLTLKRLEVAIAATVIIMLLSLFARKLVRSDSHDSRVLASGIDQIDRMSGEQFEEYMLTYFLRQGYQGQLTRYVGDFGADILLEKSGKRIAVQCKRWSNTVGISAVQQVVGAIRHYNADYGMVVTTSYFGPSALTLAKSNDIILWDRDFIVRNTSSIPLLHKLTELSSNTCCPMCNSSLEEKNWEKGRIIVCSKYPNCKYMKSL